MERFEGYTRKGFGTARAERLLAADRVLLRVRRWLTLLLLAVLALLVIFAVLRFRNRGGEGFGAYLLGLFGGYLLLLFVTLVLLAVFRRCYGGGKLSGKHRYLLLSSYVRSLLLDTCVALAPELRKLKKGEEILADSREYAEGYVLTEQEWALLYRAKTPVLREESERIRARFEEYLREILDGESERYLALRTNMKGIIDHWRRTHFPSYAEPQRDLLNENLSLLLQQVTDNRAFFLRSRGTHAYLELLNGVTLYRDRGIFPEDGAKKPLPLPTEKEYSAYLSTVEKLRRMDKKDLCFSLHGRYFDDYRELLDAYRAFHATRATVGCPVLDIQRYEKYEKTVVADATRCWRCKLRFHPRYKRVCPKCHHHVCPRCGSCYCDKHIMHRSFRRISED